MKFTNHALTSAALGLANAGPVSKRAINDTDILSYALIFKLGSTSTTTSPSSSPMYTGAAKKMPSSLGYVISTGLVTTAALI